MNAPLSPPVIAWSVAMGPLRHGVEAARALQAGQWTLAGTHLELALHALPDDPGLLQMRSQLAWQQGEPAVAVSHLQRAVALVPGDAPLACHLARALLVSGDAEQACRAAQHAVVLDPRNITAQLLLAEGRTSLRDWTAVERAANAALACDPASDGALMWLAQAQREQSRTADAEATLRRLLQQVPTHMQALSDLGWLLYRAGRLTEARPLCAQAASLVHADPQAASRQADSITLQNWGRVLLDCGEMEAAMQALEQALERAPDSYRATLFVGMAWQELGEPDEASQWYERSLQLDAEAIEPLERLASMALKAERFTVAHELLAAVLARSPQRAQALGHRASVHLQQGQLTEALADYRTAIALAPGWAHLHAALGQALANAGDTADAKASFETALASSPECIPALTGLLTMAKTRAQSPLKHQALELLRTQTLSAPRRASLHFGLAAYYDATKAWHKAATHMVQGNALRKSAKAERNDRYDPEGYERFVDEIIRVFTPEFFARMAQHGHASARPVFIVGMPRSGTTLAEQIIASHPDAHGAGERSFANQGLLRLARMQGVAPGTQWAALAQSTPSQIQSVAEWHLQQLAQLDGEALRVVDKMPDNFSLLGWLAILFPKARFIHCQRDLRDVALSCWITDFGRIVWANDMDHLVHRMQQYRRLMAHWQKVLPVPLHALRYERMVADQRHESERLLQAVGLPWDERCMSFFETRRLVRTASVNQVRQPMYQRAVARWQRYESLLAPVCVALADDPAYIQSPTPQAAVLTLRRKPS